MIPDDVCEAIAESATNSGDRQAFLLLSVDGDGYPHVCVLASAQLEVSPDRETFAVSVAGRGTSDNLRVRGVATIVAVAGGAGYYLKCSVQRELEIAGRSGFVLRPLDVKVDRAGVDVRPMSYRFTADLAIEERWEADRQVLQALLREDG